MSPSDPSATFAASRSPWLFLTPALALLAISVLIPAAMALVISFTRTDSMSDLHLRGTGQFPPSGG